MIMKRWPIRAWLLFYLLLAQGKAKVVYIKEAK